MGGGDGHQCGLASSVRAEEDRCPPINPETEFIEDGGLPPVLERNMIKNQRHGGTHNPPPHRQWDGFGCGTVDRRGSRC